jgi:hypothetical protein
MHSKLIWALAATGWLAASAAVAQEVHTETDTSDQSSGDLSAGHSDGSAGSTRGGNVADSSGGGEGGESGGGGDVD